jgi:hypothetical protein
MEDFDSINEFTKQFSSMRLDLHSVAKVELPFWQSEKDDISRTSIDSRRQMDHSAASEKHNRSICVHSMDASINGHLQTDADVPSENDNSLICQRPDSLSNVTDSIFAFAKQELPESSTGRGIQIVVTETESIHLLQPRAEFK